MTEQPPSGNRWEPRAADGQPDQQSDQQPGPQPGASTEDTLRQPVVPPAGPAGAAPMTPPVRRRSTAVRAGLVAGAVALFLGGGAGGYALGAVTSEDSPGTVVPGQDGPGQDGPGQDAPGQDGRPDDGNHHRGFDGVPPGGEDPQQQDGSRDGSQDGGGTGTADDA